MTIHLKPEQEALIRKHVERGAYESVEEFVERAIRRLHDELDLHWIARDQEPDKPAH